MQKAKHVIVVGNEKGGAGKTTTAAHIAIAIAMMNFKVATIDVDCRQLSLYNYIENRRKTTEANSLNLSIPDNYKLDYSNADSKTKSNEEEEIAFLECLRTALENNDFVVVDTAGSNSFLSQLAHSYANTVITPINDSFVDLDVLAKINPETYDIIKPSIYSQMVWEQKMRRAKRDGHSINWVVIRNRMSNLESKNKKRVEIAVSQLSKRVGFKIAPGFSERVIFRELFLKGLTVLDLEAIGKNMSFSHIAARLELQECINHLNIPQINQYLAKKDPVEV